MNKLMPNYGWVQNTSNLSTIRDTIDLIPEHGINHYSLMNKIKDFRIKQHDLPNRWTWDARCRIKAICACGLVTLERNIQGYVLTKLGKSIQKCNKSSDYFKGIRKLTDDEINIFRDGILSNPPVIKVLEMLFNERRTTNKGLSKYDIGAELGFVGDIGFTHYDPEWIVANGYSFNNKEGDADKWARTILSWLTQVGWVTTSSKSKKVIGRNLKLYQAVPVIEQVLRYDSKRIVKYVPSEMLCSNHHKFPKLVQKLRVIILDQLNQKKGVDLKNILIKLKENKISLDEQEVKYEILNLKQAGFRISYRNSLFVLEDKIKLDVDQFLFKGETEEEDSIDKQIKEMVVRYEGTIPSRIVDNLLRFSRNRIYANEFESTVYQYFNFVGYKTSQLGQGKGRVTDVIARYIDKNYALSYAIIIDAKASSSKYSFPIGDVRKMKEYIEKHGKELLSEFIPQHAFAFVSSDFCNNVEKPLKEISKQSKVNGTAIEVDSLLELAKRIVNKNISISQIYNSYVTNNIFKVI